MLNILITGRNASVIGLGVFRISIVFTKGWSKSGWSSIEYSESTELYDGSVLLKHEI